MARHPAGNRTLAKGVTGPQGHKRIKNERTVHRAKWPWVTGAFGVLLTGLWLAAVVIFPVNQAGMAVDCAEGRLTIVGSTAFAPTMTDVAEEYSAACGAQITVAAGGSAEGVREVARAQPGEQSSIAAMSDGRSTEATPDMRVRPVAVIVYTMIVNRAVAVDQLTADHILDAPVIRCERTSEEEVVDEVAATPGAIGYVDLASADQATRDGLPVTVQKLGGHYPDVSSAAAGYPFWTIEYLYTKDSPEDGTVLESLIGYLRTKTVYAELVDAGYTPCVTTDGQTYLLCQDR